MQMTELIEKKRDGLPLSPEEISYFVTGYTKGDIPDYQAAALLMAIAIRSMTEEETVWLTDCMVRSGACLDLSSVPGRKADKHSSGGIGDKTSLVCVPVAAACGVPVAKMSGRGLGHTGGTIDKLESIPGMNVSLSETAFLRIVRSAGLCITGQTADLAPADKKLYALRDVTATVDSIPLIAASIMSKKIAMGADCIVLDVKVGKGAFMKTREEAQQLAAVMTSIGRRMGRQTVAVLSPMDQPLGRTVGNSLEVIEAIETLQGKGPADLTEACLELASHMVALSKQIPLAEAEILCRTALQNGSALEKLRLMVRLQGGEERVIDDPSLFGRAGKVLEFRAGKRGVVRDLDALLVGKAACLLGAGRTVKDGPVNLHAGIRLLVKRGETVEKGGALALLYTDAEEENIAEAKVLMAQAYTLEEKN